MPRMCLAAAIRITAVLSLIASGCFSTEILTGSPCGKDQECGDDLRCSREGFCQPASCENNPDCTPYSFACADDGGGQECPAVGARGCFSADAEPDSGYCALSCDDSAQCPGGDGATATPQCVPADVGEGLTARFCALDCGDSRNCPANMRCLEVEVAGTSRALCMSAAES